MWAVNIQGADGNSAGNDESVMTSPSHNPTRSDCRATLGLRGSRAASSSNIASHTMTSSGDKLPVGLAADIIQSSSKAALEIEFSSQVVWGSTWCREKQLFEERREPRLLKYSNFRLPVAALSHVFRGISGDFCLVYKTCS